MNTAIFTLSYPIHIKDKTIFKYVQIDYAARLFMSYNAHLLKDKNYTISFSKWLLINKILVF